MTPILDEGATVECPHPVSTTQAMSASSRVKVDGKRVTTLAHGWTVTKCQLSEGSTPPCVSGMFNVGAHRVCVDGTPVATLQSTGPCAPRPTDMLTAKQAQARVQVDFP